MDSSVIVPFIGILISSGIAFYAIRYGRSRNRQLDMLQQTENIDNRTIALIDRARLETIDLIDRQKEELKEQRDRITYLEGKLDEVIRQGEQKVASLEAQLEACKERMIK